MPTPYPGPTAYHDDHVATDEGGSNWDLLEAIVARWRVLIVLPLVSGAVAYALTFAVSPTYTSTTSFIADAPDRSSALGGFASVAAQLGVGFSSSPTSSPAFYADVLYSNEVMGRVLQSRIPGRVGALGDSLLVMELYARKKKTPEEWMDRALKGLRKNASVSVNPRTGIIELKTSAPQAQASMLVARRFVEVLNEFNLGTRQSQARQRRRFTGDRLRESQDSLARLEDALQVFLQTNRSFREAPALQARYDRLQRQISVYQELYTTLRREYEAARISEVNDTPLITVVERATVPLRRSAPNRGLMAVVGAMLGGFVALVWLLVVSSLGQLRTRRRADYERLVQVSRTFLGTLGARGAQRK